MPTNLFTGNKTTHHFTPVTDGQTSFVLPSTPADATTVRLIVNGVTHDPVQTPSVLTIATATITWTDVLHTIASTDTVVAEYQ